MNCKRIANILKPSCYLLIAAIVSIFSATVAAQSILSDPNFGSVTLAAGFSPDPQVRTIIAGGSTEIASCAGYFSEAPDLNLNYESGIFDLGIFTKSGVDTTIAVNAPNGDWICNDDSDYLGGTNAGVLIENPQSGLYNIWVGAYTAGDAYKSVSLAITELATTEWDGMALSENIAQQNGLNISAAPNYGAISLVAGFTPDPNVHDITAGGSVTGAECSGYFSPQPDINLTYTAGDFDLGIFSKAGEDTIIAINDPNGAWICNDDSEYMTDLNPAVLIENPTSGLYNIWVGTFSESSAPPTQLVFTELAAASWSTMALVNNEALVEDPNEEEDTVSFEDLIDNIADDSTIDDVVDDSTTTIDASNTTFAADEDSSPVQSRVQFGRKNN
jgi:hypothetical protein